MSKLLLKEVVNKYYTELNDMINDLAQKCTGGEEVTIVLQNGKVTIKLL